MVWPGLLIILLSAPAPPGEPTALLGVDPSGFPEIAVFMDAADGRLLGPEDVTLREAGERVSVTTIEPAGPWTLMLVLDDGPAAGALEAPMRGLLSRLARELPSGSAVGVVVAGDSLRLLPPTADWEKRAQASLTFQAARARLLDAMPLAAYALQGRTGPRGVVVIRAGGDGASHVDQECARLWAARAGVPLWDLSLSGEPDPEIAPIVAASGTRPLLSDEGGDTSNAAAELVDLLGRTWRVRYLSPARTPRGHWTDVEAPALAAVGQPPLRGGYVAPPDGEASTFVPRVGCPVPLEALPILVYDESGRHFRAWGLAGRSLSLPPGRYRCIAATRPRVERVVELRAGSGERVIAMRATLRRGLPPGAEDGSEYRITSERTGRPVGIARSGEPTPLPPGSYGVQLLGAATLRRTGIGVAAGRAVSLDLSGWASVTFELTDASGESAAAGVEMTRDGESYAGVTNQPLLAPPGDWQAIVQTRPAQHVGTVTLGPAEVREIRMPPLGSLTVELLGSDGAPAREAWVTSGGDHPAEVASGVTGTATSLPPGDYTVTVLTSPPVEVGAVVSPGRNSVVSSGGLVSLPLAIEGHDGEPRALKYSLVDSIYGGRVASGVTGRPLDIQPGTYDVDVWTFPHLVVEGVSVPEGVNSHVARASLGALELHAPPGVRLGVYLITEDGDVPAATLDASQGGDDEFATVELLPGRYRACRLEPADFEYTDREFTIGGGEVYPLRIAAEDLPVAAEEDTPE